MVCVTETGDEIESDGGARRFAVSIVWSENAVSGVAA
jgi:hypothetical protein